MHIGGNKPGRFNILCGSLLTLTIERLMTFEIVFNLIFFICHFLSFLFDNMLKPTLYKLECNLLLFEIIMLLI